MYNEHRQRSTCGRPDSMVKKQTTSIICMICTLKTGAVANTNAPTNDLESEAGGGVTSPKGRSLGHPATLQASSKNQRRFGQKNKSYAETPPPNDYGGQFRRRGSRKSFLPITYASEAKSDFSIRRGLNRPDPTSNFKQEAHQLSFRALPPT